MALIIIIIGAAIFFVTLTITSLSTANSLKTLSTEEKALWLDHAATTLKPLLFSLISGLILGILSMFYFLPLVPILIGLGAIIGTWLQYRIMTNLQLNTNFTKKLRRSTWLFTIGTTISTFLISQTLFLV